MTLTPRISIVTTNFNGAAFLEQAMLSVLNQQYPNLEYIVIDGGSSDGSQEIIEKYASHLSFWVSERDEGFAHAYNKGFAHATGDILAYLNSDDAYCPWAFDIVGRCFHDVPEMQWLTTLFPLTHSVQTSFVNTVPCQPFHRDLFYSGLYGRHHNFIQQESTFWRRELWQATGGHLDETLSLAIDAELWTRFFERADLYAVATPLAGFRLRPDSKSASQMPAYIEEFERTLSGSARRIGAQTRLPPGLGRIGRRLINALPMPLLPKLWRYQGKTVRWNYEEGHFFSQNMRILF